jgi:hypothetical protein
MSDECFLSYAEAQNSDKGVAVSVKPMTEENIQVLKVDGTEIQVPSLSSCDLGMSWANPNIAVLQMSLLQRLSYRCVSSVRMKIVYN